MIGEIRFRGPSVAAGYFRNAEQTRLVFGGERDDGWLRTGDLGYVADGELYISGRKKDILIIHGRNYYPQAIEWQIEEVAGVRKGNVVVFSVPGPDTEEIVVVGETAETDAAKRAHIAEAVKRHVNEEMALAIGNVTLVGVRRAAEDDVGQAAAPKDPRTVPGAHTRHGRRAQPVDERAADLAGAPRRGEHGEPRLGTAWRPWFGFDWLDHKSRRNEWRWNGLDAG